jgi:2,3,4,5-tetrahydropyridine-2-carboxylate N-succinyltransferase
MSAVHPHTLEPIIDHWFAQGEAAIGQAEALHAFERLRSALEDGTLRSAEPDPAAPSGWRVNAWVKRAIRSASASAPLKR